METTKKIQTSIDQPIGADYARLTSTYHGIFIKLHENTKRSMALFYWIFHSISFSDGHILHFHITLWRLQEGIQEFNDKQTEILAMLSLIA